MNRDQTCIRLFRTTDRPLTLLLNHLGWEHKRIPKDRSSAGKNRIHEGLESTSYFITVDDGAHDESTGSGTGRTQIWNHPRRQVKEQGTDLTGHEELTLLRPSGHTKSEAGSEIDGVPRSIDRWLPEAARRRAESPACERRKQSRGEENKN